MVKYDLIFRLQDLIVKSSLTIQIQDEENRKTQAGAKRVMGKAELSTQEIFMRLGDTPAIRSARAEKLFRKLRTGERDDTTKTILASASRSSRAVRRKIASGE